MDKIRKVFAFRMRELRGKKKQVPFCEEIGVPITTYQTWEAGRIPHEDQLENLIEKLGIESETRLFMDPDIIGEIVLRTVLKAFYSLNETDIQGLCAKAKTYSARPAPAKEKQAKTKDSRN